MKHLHIVNEVSECKDGSLCVCLYAESSWSVYFYSIYDIQPVCLSWNTPEVQSKHLIGGEDGTYDERSALGDVFS
jgi:hypothetical protein